MPFCKKTYKEVTFQAASYWKEPIAWGGASTGHLWAGIIDGVPGETWIGIWQMLGLTGVILLIWFLINRLGRGSN